jgi:ribose 5-phosphate isomerase A
VIIDVHGLDITKPVAMEALMNNIVGIVTVGLFAKQGANVCLLGTEQGVQTLTF